MKKVTQVLPQTRSHWVGNGFNVFPVLDGLAFTKDVTPFLMLDYAAPKMFAPSNKKLGVGQHPHRGFETVTIAFHGEVEHGDSSGNHDVIKEGDIQWMTAGRGIIHEEFHSKEFSQRGGLFEMVQLWVNLPSSEKMTRPKYQAISGKSVPVVELPDGSGFVRVIAGELDGVKGKASTFTPINLWDVRIPAGKTITDLPIPEGHNTMVLVRRGILRVVDGESAGGGATVRTDQVAMLSYEGDKISFQNIGGTTGAARALLGDEEDPDEVALLVLSGAPIDEPIAARGPFVMNTRSELDQAMRDYQTGKLAKHF